MFKKRTFLAELFLLFFLSLEATQDISSEKKQNQFRRQALDRVVHKSAVRVLIHSTTVKNDGINYCQEIQWF